MAVELMDSQIDANQAANLASESPQSLRVEESTTEKATPGLRQLFLGGGILFGFAIALQRLFGFVTTVVAARIGGASVLGEYSVALSTAGMVSGFVGVGVGTVALRYIGQFPRNTQAYRKILRLVIIITAIAAVSSTLVLLVGSEFAARYILKNESLGQTLRIAAVSSLAFILVEALNGMLIGLHHFRGLLWLAIVSGIGMVVAVSFAARYGASAMLVGYTIALGLGIAVTVMVTRNSIRPLPPSGGLEPVAPRTREVVLFGNAQQINTIVLALASWWVIVTVTRYDPSFREMGYYVVGSQLRVLASQAPTLAAMLVLPTLARTTPLPDEQRRVISTSTFLCVALSLVPAGIALVLLPWILRPYGIAFRPAAITCSILLATAVLQLSYIPAANALLILSLRTSVITSIMGCLCLALLAFIMSPLYGAAGAAAAWLLSQAFAQVVVLIALKRRGRLPPGVAMVCSLGNLAIIALASLAILRVSYPAMTLLLTGIELALLLIVMLGLVRGAQARGYLPKDARTALANLRSGPAFFMNYLASTRGNENQA